MKYRHIYTVGFWQSNTIQVIKRNTKNEYKEKRIINGIDLNVWQRCRETKIPIFKRVHGVNYRSVTGTYKAFLRFWKFY